jgi:hypothetical protein
MVVGGYRVEGIHILSQRGVAVLGGVFVEFPARPFAMPLKAWQLC